MRDTLTLAAGLIFWLVLTLCALADFRSTFLMSLIVLGIGWAVRVSLELPSLLFEAGEHN